MISENQPLAGLTLKTTSEMACEFTSYGLKKAEKLGIESARQTKPGLFRDPANRLSNKDDCCDF